MVSPTISTQRKVPSRRFHSGPSPKLMPWWMRSSGASAETSRAKPGTAMSMSSIREMSVGRVVRGYRDHARSVRPVAPRVAGSPLHDGVARLKLHLLGVEHEGDLALQNHAEIESARLLYPGVRRTRVSPERGVGRKADDAAKRPARRGRERLRGTRGLARSADSRRRRVGSPDEGR